MLFVVKNDAFWWTQKAKAFELNEIHFLQSQLSELAIESSVFCCKWEILIMVFAKWPKPISHFFLLDSSTKWTISSTNSYKETTQRLEQMG